jgi:xanthine/uracil/vitamin C permease (AzgA family)
VGAGLGLLLQTKLSVELINASAGVYQLLLAGVKGVTLGADFDLDVLFCAPRLNDLSASAPDRRLLIVGMYPFLHNCSPLSDF